MLFRAIKHQVDKGPVDAVTGKAKYTLNDNRLLREDVEYRTLVSTHRDTIYSILTQAELMCLQYQRHGNTIHCKMCILLKKADLILFLSSFLNIFGVIEFA